MENFLNFNSNFACGVLLMLLGPISTSYHKALCKHKSDSIHSLVWGVVVLAIGLLGIILGLYLSLKEFFNVSIWDSPLIIVAFLLIRCIKKRGSDFFSKYFFQ